ncbi:uncharacterized protein [Drosophila virilis]|uniref:Uncharacterized protein, isoform A n=1 Tax=Drosophila virilis TaxID=7244 RepID=A0A0Q9WZ78_DROVI|nr:uncharacterized protein LOC116650132 isoform X2 [Drosophila virilis]KRF77558.1 uncharacterized protein Dvir_GJ26475 [Drosophila virilis]KRF77733.1 uncharacterized protein Dvir_GJ27088 [Drosophila virilis]KRF77739.1 uncharacterized protein Dvir_GJ27067 [Drosophila virilis]KRF77742.1 uncharacterized protein Dvir_GJ26295, isoform A [Drosophila virilis]KRF85473.1 uncharacterized protein Dvir_GJ26757, isoform B [Drosophila virilis]
MGHAQSASLDFFEAGAWPLTIAAPSAGAPARVPRVLGGRYGCCEKHRIWPSHSQCLLADTLLLPLPLVRQQLILERPLQSPPN